MRAVPVARKCPQMPASARKCPRAARKCPRPQARARGHHVKTGLHNGRFRGPTAQRTAATAEPAPPSRRIVTRRRPDAAVRSKSADRRCNCGGTTPSVTVDDAADTATKKCGFERGFEPNPHQTHANDTAKCVGLGRLQRGFSIFSRVKLETKPHLNPR